MKTTNHFTNTIKGFLDGVASKDSAFAEKYINPKKSIEECVSYILGTVKDSGVNGFADEEIYGMAIHYYDEENLKLPSKVDNAHVVVNYKVQLTEEEVQAEREKAKAKVLADEKNRMTKKPTKKKIESNQPTLF